MRSRTWGAAIVLAGLALAGACSGDDSDSSEATAETDGTAAATGTDDGGDGGEVVAELPAECPAAVPFEMELRLDGELGRDTFEIADAVALRRHEGRAWTVYLADFEIPDDTSWDFAVPEVPPGKVLVSTGLDVFNATDVESLPVLEAGASGATFREVGEGETAMFLSVMADGAASSSVEQVGTTELLHVDDEQVCLAVELTGTAGQELVGVYTAPVVADI